MDYTIYRTKKDMRPGKKFGEICYCEEEQKIYRWTNLTWEPYKFSGENFNTSVTTYELNKQVFTQLPSLTTDEELEKCKETISTLRNSNNQYYLLLCNELYYYTIFRITDYSDENFEDVVIECLQDWGEIKSVYYNKDYYYVECWVKKDNDCNLFLLFDYDGGVIKCQ